MRSFRALDYDISPDGRQVVMETTILKESRGSGWRRWTEARRRIRSPTWSADRPDLVRAVKSSSAAAPKGVPRGHGRDHRVRLPRSPRRNRNAQGARTADSSAVWDLAGRPAGSRHGLRFQATAPHLLRPFRWMGTLQSLSAGAPSDGQGPVRQESWVLYHFLRTELTLFLWLPARFCRRYQQEDFVPRTR